MQRQSPDKDTPERASRDRLGHLLGRLFVVSIGSLALSILSIVVLGLLSVKDEITLETSDPPVVALVVSWVGVWSSALCYSGWSFLKLRRMQPEHSQSTERTVVSKGSYLVALTLERVDEPTAYEKRLQLALQSFVFGGLFLVLSVHSVVTEQRIGRI